MLKEIDISDILSKCQIPLNIGIFIIILTFLFIHLDKVFLFKGFVCECFSKVSSAARKGAISNKVRGTVIGAAKEVTTNNMNIMPFDLKINWIQDEKKQTFISGNKVIVRMKQSSNINENLIVATSAFVKEGLLPNERRYLNKEVMEVSSTLMLRKIIRCSGHNALTYLDEKYLIPRLENDEDFKSTYEDLVRIDNNGMFVGIMLNEYYKAATKISGELPDDELIAESKEFMRFLHSIAYGTISSVEELDFNRDYFKVSIFLASNDKTLMRNGINSTINQALKQLNNGIETIYVFGLGRKMNVAREIAKELEKDIRIKMVQKNSYKHMNIDNNKRISGVFYECSVYLN